jgi:hypothetical protein
LSVAPMPLPVVVEVGAPVVAVVAVVPVVDVVLDDPAVVEVVLEEPAVEDGAGCVVLGAVDPVTEEDVVSPTVVDVVDVVVSWAETSSSSPRSPGWAIASVVPAAKTMAAAPRMSFWLTFRGTYLGTLQALGVRGPDGAGDGNRTRTTSLEGWGSSR